MLWTAGIVPSDWTSLPDSDFTKATEVCHPCNGIINKVYIDGSATKVGAMCFAGWGLWTPDNPSFNDCGPLLGEEQGSDRAEVRVLVAALDKYEETIEVITDNQH
eukprot:15327794-Heterocapsa_arctica.AAC.1